MKKPSPEIQDLRPNDNNSPTKAFIIGIASLALLVIVGSIFFLRSSSILAPTIESGTYLKLSVTPNKNTKPTPLKYKLSTALRY